MNDFYETYINKAVEILESTNLEEIAKFPPVPNVSRVKSALEQAITATQLFSKKHKNTKNTFELVFRKPKIEANFAQHTTKKNNIEYAMVTTIGASMTVSYINVPKREKDNWGDITVGFFILTADGKTYEVAGKSLTNFSSYGTYTAEQLTNSGVWKTLIDKAVKDKDNLGFQIKYINDFLKSEKADFEIKL
jgi:hypothetical protein